MNLAGFMVDTPEAELRGLVRHLTGHCLGLPHEHLPKALVDCIEPGLAIDFFGGLYGWSRDIVEQEVLTPLEECSILGSTGASYLSVMSWQIPAKITRDGRPIIGGRDIDPTDGEIVAGLYPRSSAAGVERGSCAARGDRPSTPSTSSSTAVERPGFDGVLYFGPDTDPDFVAKVIDAVEGD